MKRAFVFLLVWPAVSPVSAGAAEYRDVLIDGVPHVEQRPDFCGEACAEMWLKRLGHSIDQNAVFGAAELDPLRGRGLVTNELRHALERLGFEVGSVWRSHDPKRAAETIEDEWRALHTDLVAGVPSIVCMHYSDSPSTTEHFRLILGYDAKSDEVIYHEPAEANGAYRRMDRALFQKLWTFKPSPKRWTTIRLRLEPRSVAALSPADGISEAEYVQRIMELREKIGRDKFTIFLERPFVVIGDGDPADVKKHAARVRWTMELLRKDFFAQDPREIIDVWVFKNERTYRKYAKQLFNEEPDTPYGYYSPSNHALVMNIGPGYGTLVHELVHPYVHTNFPECPPWLNEGLASLYERPIERNGHIVGLVNWRLPGLKRAIRDRSIPSFRTLTAMNDAKFYDDDSGTNYAAARYIAYDLQERGLLVRFVREFMEGRAHDATGYQTLKRVLGEEDLPAFQLRWEAAMMELELNRGRPARAG